MCLLIKIKEPLSFVSHWQVGSGGCSEDLADALPWCDIMKTHILLCVCQECSLIPNIIINEDRKHQVLLFSNKNCNLSHGCVFRLCMTPVLSLCAQLRCTCVGCFT
jgi:hypothetical protein